MVKCSKCKKIIKGLPAMISGKKLCQRCYSYGRPLRGASIKEYAKKWGYI